MGWRRDWHKHVRRVKSDTHTCSGDEIKFKKLAQGWGHSSVQPLTVVMPQWYTSWHSFQMYVFKITDPRQGADAPEIPYDKDAGVLYEISCV